METKYMRTFEDYNEASKDDEANQPEPVKDKITDPGWIRHYIESGEPFCILSAYQANESAETNAQNHEALEKDTLKSKYAYHVMAFRYRCLKGGQMVKAVYKSLFVPKMPLRVGLDLAKHYGQPHVVVRGNDGLDFISVADENLLLSIKPADLKNAWCAFLFASGAFLSK